MKQRIITAVIGLALLAVVLFCYETPVYDGAVCIITLIAVHELLLAMKVTRNIPLTVLTLLTAAIPFFTPLTQTPKDYFSLSVTLYAASVFLGFLLMLKQHDRLDFQTVATAYFIAAIVPFSFYALIHIRDSFGWMQGLFYTLVIFASAWGADSGAYFAGRFFGKRKLAPKISPNKTVEGLIGGIISALVLVVLITWGYLFLIGRMTAEGWLERVPLLVITPLLSLAGVGGDLFASVIKRQNGLKDFGTIMPGHGGILDRFDSVFFIAPLFYLILLYLPAA